MIMTRANLDVKTANGCQKLGCDHGGHEHHDTLFLHSRCHIDVPLTVARRDDALLLACPKCRSLVGGIANAAPVPVIHCELCHGKDETNSFVWPTYQHGSGVLKLECCHCKKVVAEIELQ
jgi:hypothetical protein